MKKWFLSVAVVLFVLSGSLVWAGPFGAPAPLVPPGKIALGIGYFYQAEKLKQAGETFAGNPNFWQKADFKSHQAYLQASYGLGNWEVFGRLGGQSLVINDVFVFSAGKKDFRDPLEPFGGIGFKGIVWRNSTFAVGPVFQANYYSKLSDSATGDIGGAAASLSYEVKEYWDINLGISAQARLAGMTFFAGPYFYWKNARVELTVTAAGAAPVRDAVRYQPVGFVGGFAGFRIPITKNLSLEAEGQYSNKLSGGASVTLSF